MTSRRTLLAAVLVSALFTACAATPTMPSGDGARGTVFRRPLDEAHAAAEDAVAVFGFALDRSEPSHVEGRRPRGGYGGGEAIGIWLEPMGPDRTRVLVDTGRTFFGGAGQMRWDAPVLSEMARYLGEPEAQPDTGR